MLTLVMVLELPTPAEAIPGDFLFQHDVMSLYQGEGFVKIFRIISVVIRSLILIIRGGGGAGGNSHQHQIAVDSGTKPCTEPSCLPPDGLLSPLAKCIL